MENVLGGWGTTIRNVQSNLHTLHTASFENNPYILALMLSIVLFSFYLLISLSKNHDLKLALGCIVPLIFIPIAQAVSTDRLWLDTSYSIVVEIIGGFVVFGIFAMLNNLHFDFTLSINYHNVRAIVSCTMLVGGSILFSLLFVLLCLNNTEYLRVALVLFVEILAGMMVNFFLLATIITLIGLKSIFNIIFRHQSIKVMSNSDRIKFCIGFGILLLTIVLMTALTLIFTTLPENITNPSFPQNLAFACVGAIFSVLAAELLQKFDSSTNIPGFFLVRLILLGLAVGFFLLGSSDKNILLSIITELIGVILVVTLVSDHMLSRSHG